MDSPGLSPSKAHISYPLPTTQLEGMKEALLKACQQPETHTDIRQDTLLEPKKSQQQRGTTTPAIILDTISCRPLMLSIHPDCHTDGKRFLGTMVLVPHPINPLPKLNSQLSVWAGIPELQITMRWYFFSLYLLFDFFLSLPTYYLILRYTIL